MPSAQSLDFIGFGRVIERHKPQDLPVQCATLLSTPSSQSTTSTNLSLTQNFVLPEEASLVCQNVLAELAQLTPSRMVPTKSSMVSTTVLTELACGMVEILVKSCKNGCVCGHLCWGNMDPQVIMFMLQEIRPGHTVVENVQAGPQHFRRLSWKLKFVNACLDVSPTLIEAGDTLVLENVHENRSLMAPEEPQAPQMIADCDDLSKHQQPIIPKLDLSSINKARQILRQQPLMTPANCECKQLWGCL